LVEGVCAQQRGPRGRALPGRFRGQLLLTRVLGVLAALICLPTAASTVDADDVVVSSVDIRDDKRRVTVVVPTFNRAAQLEVAVRSVLASPLITSPDQVIVVDDDSQDDTADVVRRLGVSYVRFTGHSVARNRNVGWHRADTEYVSFLDDDDAWLPGNLEPQLAALDAHPRAGFAYGQARCATEGDLTPLDATFPSAPLVSGHAPGQLHAYSHYPQLGSVLFRRQALEEVDGFDPRVHYSEDGDLILRVAARREIVGVESVGVLYRIREPCRARADYFWPLRDVARWRPKGAGVGWKPALKFQVATRALFFTRFVEDAAVCAAAGQRWDALVCAARAAWVSPLHAIRHRHLLRTTVLELARNTALVDART
jgi:glycosyltransferase involved in cell wall biosynthesis